jgi:predicted  nucleic acid-binding Zn-ribbon protein
MEEIYQSLLELQELDNEIILAQKRVREFEPELDLIDAPANALAQDTEGVRTRLTELQAEVRRLERGAEEKRDLLKRYEERLDKVRTQREESAVYTEIDLIRGAVEADENEALQLMDQALRAELKLDELEKKLAEARAEIGPRRRELEAAQAAASDELAVIRDRRENRAVRLDPKIMQLYDRIRAGKTQVVITGLTPDGACGSCFGFIPIQRQVEIQQGPDLLRCEECGVILHPGN